MFHPDIEFEAARREQLRGQRARERERRRPEPVRVRTFRSTQRRS
ncbi:MAG: hypothetical protein ACTMIR_13815 [Cellulomonadaceae bacterium]